MGVKPKHFIKDCLYRNETVNLHAKFGTTILYKSPRGSVLRTPATLTGIRTFRPPREPVLIPDKKTI